MALLNIRVTDDPILRKVAKPVKEITPKILTLLDDMKETMINKHGLGLAAPQVGILRRVVTVLVDEEVVEMINPEILEADGEQTNTEGCLSFPGKYGKVCRPAYMKVKYTDRNGQDNIIEGNEILAVAFSHEIDHLNGILYVDKVMELEDIDEEDLEADEEI